MERIADSIGAGGTRGSQAQSLSCCTSPLMPPAMRRSPVPWSVERFELQQRIYEGKTSRLYVATDKPSGTPVALKLYRKHKLSPLNKCQVEREINIHIRLAHENIIQLYAAFEDTENVYMVQELAGGGDLFYKVKGAPGRQFNEHKTAEEVIIPFLRALAYLHGKGIVHRDIKPENILLTSSGTIKLADFGLAIDMCEERPVTRLGTLDYMAPEVLCMPDKSLPEQNKESECAYAAQVDAWAVGVLTYELLVGFAPFDKGSRNATYDNIIKGDPEFPTSMSRSAKSFICAALCKVPHQRPSVTELLHHSWLQPYLTDKSRMSHLAMHRTISVPCNLAAHVSSVPCNLAALVSSAASPGSADDASQIDRPQDLQGEGEDTLATQPSISEPGIVPGQPLPGAPCASPFSADAVTITPGCCPLLGIPYEAAVEQLGVDGEEGLLLWPPSISAAFQSAASGGDSQTGGFTSMDTMQAALREWEQSCGLSNSADLQTCGSQPASVILSDSSQLIKIGGSATQRGLAAQSPRSGSLLGSRSNSLTAVKPPASPNQVMLPDDGTDSDTASKTPAKKSMYSKIFAKLWGGKGSEAAGGLSRAHPSSPNLTAYAAASPPTSPLLYSRCSTMMLSRSAQDLSGMASGPRAPQKFSAPLSPNTQAGSQRLDAQQLLHARPDTFSTPASPLGPAACEQSDEASRHFRRANSDALARPPPEGPSRIKAKHSGRRLL